MISRSSPARTDGSVAPSLNCGLRIQGDSGPVMIAKQNSAVENQGGRDGFAVVGHLEVEDEQDVELVCYGAGIGGDPENPFEHNLVAVGG